MSSEEARNEDDEAKRAARDAAASAAGNDGDAAEAAGADAANNGAGAGTDAGSNAADGKADASVDGGDNAGDANADTDADADAADGKDGEGDGNKLTPLGQAKKEAADYLEALQRERAEFVNFRNRSKKEQEIFRQHGIIDVLTALLPALDDIDRIREHSEMDDSFTAVATKIDKAFEKFGVEKFGEKGETFDPTKHEAILHKPDANATEETVDTVVEAGYRIGERVIRAARVVVASPQA
ncbi:nucleotide exchange factor GrpE [Bifidobacterium sp. ESL0763]|uniref:nucleotide exchange factor GrpE n=1 Tax=Bifidobacterium sp. ESL0763 TaxID=2983227 RepID=UPI0023F6CB8B|nr:nucleotide exchange factor GrpE [Bifidobacterium sp. ESL0763]MDF7663220.1 nucleotide exchange factor GrpE [Bifidobacterium sp. ESL0763]